MNLGFPLGIPAKALYRGQPGTGSTTLVTTPASQVTVITSIIICNVTAANVSLQLASVPSAGSLSDANTFFKSTIVAGSTVTIDSHLVLDAAESLRALAGTAAAITVVVSGVQGVQV